MSSGAGGKSLGTLDDLGYQRWYQFGLRSPEILYRRLRSKWRPLFRLKTAYQRARYGIADSDIWGLDYFLAAATVRGTRKLREWKTGFPGELTWDDWERILLKIERGFQLWIDRDGWFENEDEAKEFDTAMALYAKWFSALWD